MKNFFLIVCIAMCGCIPHHNPTIDPSRSLSISLHSQNIDSEIENNLIRRLRAEHIILKKNSKWQLILKNSQESSHFPSVFNVMTPRRSVYRLSVDFELLYHKKSIIKKKLTTEKRILRDAYQIGTHYVTSDIREILILKMVNLIDSCIEQAVLDAALKRLRS